MSIMFAVYRLRTGVYRGWRVRDVWRHDPQALLAASRSLTTPMMDAAAIDLFMALFGGLTHRSVGGRDSEAGSGD